MIYLISLPWPPTTNHFHIPVRMGKGARCIKSPKIEIYQREVCLILRSMNLHKNKINKPVTLSVLMSPKTKARFDVSNFLKAFEDGLVAGGFLEDDHWIEYDKIKKGDPIKGGKITLLVEHD